MDMNVFDPLKPLTYRCILADPPWNFATYSAKGHGKSPQKHYRCMSLMDIKALPVLGLAHPEGASLVMWATAPMLPQAIDTMRTWGFTFKSAGAWAKRTKTDTAWAFGTGYCYRSAAEFYLLGTYGRPTQTSKSVRNLIVAATQEHSRKPGQMHVDLELLWPGPRCELFARRQRDGWDIWGDQAPQLGEEGNEQTSIPGFDREADFQGAAVGEGEL